MSKLPSMLTSNPFAVVAISKQDHAYVHAWGLTHVARTEPYASYDVRTAILLFWVAGLEIPPLRAIVASCPSWADMFWQYCKKSYQISWQSNMTSPTKLWQNLLLLSFHSFWPVATTYFIKFVIACFTIFKFRKCSHINLTWSSWFVGICK